MYIFGINYVKNRILQAVTTALFLSELPTYLPSSASSNQLCCYSWGGRVIAHNPAGEEMVILKQNGAVVTACKIS